LDIVCDACVLIIGVDYLTRRLGKSTTMTQEAAELKA